eukprot:5607163-Pyramimonas_sp.AAC.1
MARGPQPVVHESYCQGQVISEPSEFMGEKRKDWRALWADPVDDAEAIAHMLQQLHGESRRDPLPPLGLESLERVVDKLPAKAAGVDAITPRDLQRAPPQ